jgi:hypothetical protein
MHTYKIHGHKVINHTLKFIGSSLKESIRSGRVAQAVDGLCSRYEVMSSSPSAAKKIKKIFKLGKITCY